MYTPAVPLRVARAQRHRSAAHPVGEQYRATHAALRTRCAPRNKKKTWENRMTRLARMTRKKRKTKAMAAPMRLTFVADLTETAKPQLQENEKPSRRTKPDKPGKDEGEDEGERGGDDPDEKKKRRTPNTYLPQANQRSIGAPSK